MFFYSEQTLFPLILSVNSSSLTFQTIYINSTEQKSFSVSASAGNMTETITITDNSNKFSFSPSSFTLSGVESQAVVVNFSPTTTGSELGEITLSSSGGSIANVSLTGSSPYWVQRQIISGSLAVNTNDYFGRAVAINNNGNVMAISAHFDESPGRSNNGLVYVYTSGSSGWSQSAILSGSLAVDMSDQFGYSIDMNSAGNRIVVGAPYDERAVGNVDVGLAYIFVSGANGWSQQHILSGTLSLDENDVFAYSVAINSAGDRVVVGSYLDENLGGSSNTGIAYVFISGSSGWTQQKILTGSLSYIPNAGFGIEVDINSAGDRIAVGTYPSLSGKGEVYIFSSGSSEWVQEAILTGSLAQSGDRFGQSISMNAAGDRFVVGAHQDERSGGAESQGLAYVFVSSSSGWNQQTILSGTLATGSSDYFGYSVVINGNGDLIVVGARDDELITGNVDIGIAYIFGSGSSGWVQQQFITGTLAGNSYDQYGFSVAVSENENKIVVGAISDENISGATNTGMAYVLHKIG